MNRRSPPKVVLSGALVVALTFVGPTWVGCGTQAGAGDPGEAGERSAARAPADRWSFLPSHRREGTRALLPIAFPDGTRAELRYPPDLDVAGLGVTPYTSGTVPRSSGRDLLIVYGALQDYLAQRNGGTMPEMLASYPGPDGRSVGFWDMPSDSPDHLGFQFGDWAVLVWDRQSGPAMTEAQRAAWAANLEGRETPNGFLRLSATRPLRLARRNEHAGPELVFGSIGSRSISLVLERCEVPGRSRVIHGERVAWQRGSRYAFWCAADTISAHLRGGRRFIRAVIRDLAVRDRTTAAD